MIDEVDLAFASGAVSTSDLIYLAMPVGEIIGFLGERGRQIKPGAVVTDAGSTKVEVCRAARSYLTSDWHFIGGHPVAGSHLRGLSYARADLFSSAPYVLVRDENAWRSGTAALQETLDLLGARVTFMTAGEHDRVMALVSHLPQIVSSALAAITREQPDAEAIVKLAGAGYEDMTRLASSSWSVWRDILTTNATETVAALDALLAKLATVRDELRDCSEHGAGQLTTTSLLFEESGPAGAPARNI